MFATADLQGLWWAICGRFSLSFYNVGSTDQTQILRFFCKYLYLLSHLPSTFSKEFCQTTVKIETN